MEAFPRSIAKHLPCAASIPNERDFVTEASVNLAEDTERRWEELYRFLLVQFLNDSIKHEQDGVLATNEWGNYPIVEHPQCPEWWLRLIVEETGE